MDPRHVDALTETRLLRVRGRVQGVGFRDACVRAAIAAGLAGWVRNRHDGSVELLLQGPRAAVERLQRWLPDGVRAARVDVVEPQALDADPGQLSGFERRPTA
jgi:acylphosphatase